MPEGLLGGASDLVWIVPAVPVSLGHVDYVGLAVLAPIPPWMLNGPGGAGIGC